MNGIDEVKQRLLEIEQRVLNLITTDQKTSCDIDQRATDMSVGVMAPAEEFSIRRRA
jgi:hypothetical protein